MKGWPRIAIMTYEYRVMNFRQLSKLLRQHCTICAAFVRTYAAGHDNSMDGVNRDWNCENEEKDIARCAPKRQNETSDDSDPTNPSATTRNDTEVQCNRCTALHRCQIKWSRAVVHRIGWTATPGRSALHG